MDEMNSIQLTVSKLDVEFDQILVNLKPHVIKLQQQSGQFLSVNSKMLLHVEHGIFLSERELSPVRLSVCRLSVTLVRPTQVVQIFGNISAAFGTLAIH